MELAFTVLAWTGAVCAALVTIMAVAHLGAQTDLARARTITEKRYQQ